MYKEIGERIKHLRISKKLTQDEVVDLFELNSYEYEIMITEK